MGRQARGGGPGEAGRRFRGGKRRVRGGGPKHARQEKHWLLVWGGQDMGLGARGLSLTSRQVAELSDGSAVGPQRYRVSAQDRSGSASTRWLKRKARGKREGMGEMESKGEKGRQGGNGRQGGKGRQGRNGRQTGMWKAKGEMEGKGEKATRHPPFALRSALQECARRRQLLGWMDGRLGSHACMVMLQSQLRLVLNEQALSERKTHCSITAPSAKKAT
eukprot:278607-Chlamydomonas_euryale.AAC.4